jgi:hypothetical protein
MFPVSATDPSVLWTLFSEPKQVPIPEGVEQALPPEKFAYAVVVAKTAFELQSRPAVAPAIKTAF